MVIDSSAIIALLKAEQPEAPSIAKVIADAPWGQCAIGAPTLLEIKIVIDGQFENPEEGLKELELFLDRHAIQIVPFTEKQSEIAFEAYQHCHRPPARLNFGDCFAYALAKARNEPLLCKGNDFKHTDLQLVSY